MVLAIVSAGCYNPKYRVPDLVKSPMPADVLNDSELPKNYDLYYLSIFNYFLVVILMDVHMLLLLRISIFPNTVVLVGLLHLHLLSLIV